MYIIVTKRIRNYSIPREPLSQEEQFYVCATETPSHVVEFSQNFKDIKSFGSLNNARNWFLENKEHLFRGERKFDYDTNSVTIKEILVQTIETLKI